MRRYLPVLAFALLLLLLGVGLTLKPSELPSALIDKPMPVFELAYLEQPQRVMRSSDMLGKVWLLNVWASWCGACRSEHAALMRISSLGDMPIVGLNMKDESDAARRWLADGGNPYTAVVADPQGIASMDLGVYGVPETFVIDRQGYVRYRHAGPIDDAVFQQTLLPLIETLENEP